MKFRIALLLLALPFPGFASSLAFFPDGKKVAVSAEESVMVKDLATLEEKPLTLPEGIAVSYPSVAVTADRLLVLTDSELLGLEPGTGKWETLCKAPEGVVFDEVAVNPATAQVLLTTRGMEEEADDLRWWVLGKEKDLQKVFIRSIGLPVRPVFDAKGNLYFCHEGDVWKGSIEAEEDLPFALEAKRFWPVAEAETSSGNGRGEGAIGILPLEKHLLVDKYRIGGSGWGNLIRIPNASAWEGKVSLGGTKLAPSMMGTPLALSYDGRQAVAWSREKNLWYRVDPATGSISPLVKPAPPKKKG